MYTASAEFTTPHGQIRSWGVSAFDQRFVDLGPPALQERGSYATDEQAYRAVLADPGLVIVNEFSLMAGGGGPVATIGDRLTITNPETLDSRTVRVAAVASAGVVQTGALYGHAGARSLLGGRLVTNPLFVATDGVDPDRFAAETSAAFVANGAQADAIETLVTQTASRQLQFLGLIRGYLALGLVVGVAGLGVIMVRAVRERRRQIGILRALGFQPSTVRRSFVIESAFVASEGVLIGVVLALVNFYTLVATSEVFGAGLEFSVPAVPLAILVLGTLAVSLLATAAPSQAASKVRPAIALRNTD